MAIEKGALFPQCIEMVKIEPSKLSFSIVWPFISQYVHRNCGQCNSPCQFATMLYNEQTFALFVMVEWNQLSALISRSRSFLAHIPPVAPFLFPARRVDFCCPFLPPPPFFSLQFPISSTPTLDQWAHEVLSFFFVGVPVFC